MTATIKPNWKLAIGLPSFIFIGCFCITLIPAFKSNSSLLSNAIVIDLLVTAPLVYLLAIRKTSTSKKTVSRVFILGLLFAGFILNSHSNTLLHFIKTWVSPLIETFVIFFVAKKFYVANNAAKQLGNGKVDFLLYCRHVMQQVIGNEKLGNIISSEIAVFYYAFIGRKARTADYQTRFTSYKGNGILIVFGAILFLFLTETTAMHFLLISWNKTAAWIIFGLSLYSCLQLLAHIRAVKARPIIINNDSVEIHNGLAGDAMIDFANIEKIELNNKLPQGKQAIKIALIKGLENHNCIIYLKRPIEVTKVFGIRRQTDTVLFFVDKPKEFINALEEKL